MFTKAIDMPEADSWLHMTEAKFSLLRCLETQKRLFTAQQLCGSTSAWWETFTTTLPSGYLVSWTEFHEAFQRAPQPLRPHGTQVARVPGP
jgi:hypothetical protein